MPTEPTEITVGGITAEISIVGPFRFGSNRQGSDRTVTYQVDGADAAEFCDGLLGIGAHAAPGGWPNPHKYVENTNLVCQRVDGLPIGARMPDRQLLRGVLAHIVADYATPYYDITGDSFQPIFGGSPVPWSNLTASESFEEHAVDVDILEAEEDGTPLTQTLRRRVGITEYVYRRMMIPTLQLNAFRNILRPLRGKLNNATFMGAATGTLFFQSFAWNTSRDSSGALVHEFEMTIREREKDWRMVPSRTSLTDWITPQDNAGNKNYELASFLPIITYGIGA